MTFMPNARILAATTALLCSPALVGTAPAQAQDGGFRDCLNSIKADALKQGVPAQVVDRAFQGLTPDQKVVDLDNRQPEFSLTYAKYVGGTVSLDRIQKGQQKMAQHRALLDQLQAEYGIPPQYIMAFWGIETNYGTYMGDFRVVRSVATLACMTKRRDFFSNETVQALRILNMNHMTSDQMRGSWAGAMGNMQFMPSTAVDRLLQRGRHRVGHDLCTGASVACAHHHLWRRDVGKLRDRQQKVADAPRQNHDDGNGGGKDRPADEEVDHDYLPRGDPARPTSAARRERRAQSDRSAVRDGVVSADFSCEARGLQARRSVAGSTPSARITARISGSDRASSRVRSSQRMGMSPFGKNRTGRATVVARLVFPRVLTA